MSALRPAPTTLISTLTLTPSLAGDKLDLALQGSAEMQDSSPLTEVLMHYHGEATRLRASVVSVDFRRVEFMNSSALNAFLRWFAAFKQAGTAGYQVKLVTNPKVRWQRGSLNALASFAAAHVTVEASDS